MMMLKRYILSVGVEPTTLGLLDPRSNQLSYESEFLVAIIGQCTISNFQQCFNNLQIFFWRKMQNMQVHVVVVMMGIDITVQQVSIVF
jgi:hypothetical protein